MSFRFLNQRTKPELPEFWKSYEAKFEEKLRKDTPIDEVRFVVFDTETTGLDTSKDYILSLAAITVQENQIVVNDRLELFIQQAYEARRASVVVHGILPGNAESAKQELEAIKAFLEFIGNAVLVAHHASFDIAMVNRALQRAVGRKLKNKVLDTAVLARRLTDGASLVNKDYFSLDSLCKLYQIPASDRHTAPGDTFITAILLLKLLARLKKRGVQKLGSLLKSRKHL
jgi:DNA polymerase-3 subunit epsilon